MNNFILEYYQGIRDGSIVVGRWIRMLYERILDGIEDGTYVYDQKKANRAIQFIESFCHHNKGKLAPGLLVLSLWQRVEVEDGKSEYSAVNHPLESSLSIHFGFPSSTEAVVMTLVSPNSTNTDPNACFV